VIARLREASSWHAGRIPDGLREHGVDALSFRVEQDSSFRISLDGLENAYRPAMEIEGRGWLDTDSSKNPVVHFEVCPTNSSVWSTIAVTVFLLGGAVYNLLGPDPPTKFGYVVFPFAAFFIMWDWMQVRMLTERAWPGLLTVIKRLVSDPGVAADRELG
jgi:hypothetical protein